MEQRKIKILVVTHKPDKVYSDDVYMPIQVGKAMSRYDLGFQGDDTGNNISEKNPMYCELTAQYWAWKNLKDVDYVGLCHYRRYFETKITSENVDKLMLNYDVVLAAPIIASQAVLSRLFRASCQEDVYIFYAVVKKLFPEYEKDLLAYLQNNIVIGYNMFVMRQYDFQKFSEWEFQILSEMEKYIKLSEYTRMKRLYGYVAEVLLPVYCLHNHLRIKYNPIVPMLGDSYHWSLKKFCRSIYNTCLFHFTWKKENVIDNATAVGLKNDGIIL